MIGLAGATLSASQLADSVETSVMFGVDEYVSKATLADQLEEEGTLADLRDYDRGASNDEDHDPTRSVFDEEMRSRSREGVSEEQNLADDVFLTLERRARIVGSHYPLSVTSTRIERRVADWREHAPYAFLLALDARYAAKLPASVQVGARLFERMVVVALRRHWCGEAVHFGWPRDPGEATRFPDAVKALVARIGERLNVPISDLPSRFNDLEIDAVAWRPLDDRRGRTVLLCQCAIGDEWEAKGIHLEQWTNIVTFAVKPYKAIAFPFVPESRRPFTDTEWEILCGKGGLPLDRLRLGQLVRPEDLEPLLRTEILAWTEGIAASLTGVA